MAQRGAYLLHHPLTLLEAWGEEEEGLVEAGDAVDAVVVVDGEGDAVEALGADGAGEAVGMVRLPARPQDLHHHPASFLFSKPNGSMVGMDPSATAQGPPTQRLREPPHG